MTRYSNDTLQFHGLINSVAQSAAVSLRCLEDMDHDLGLSIVGPDSGDTYNEVWFVGEEHSEMKCGVAALEQLLTLFSILGTNCVTADGGHPGVRLFMQAHNACAANARATGSGHQRVTAAKSQVVITTLGGNAKGTAFAKVRVIELSTDGTTAPDLVVYNAALPGTIVEDEEFVIATPEIAGVQIDPTHIRGWNIDTGIVITPIIGSDSISATAVDITKVTPVITITHDDASLMADDKIPRRGIQCDHADTVLPLQKRDPFGGLIDPDENEHILITAAGYAYHSRRYQASGSNVATGEITIRGRRGTGGIPLSIALNQPISSSS